MCFSCCSTLSPSPSPSLVIPIVAEPMAPLPTLSAPTITQVTQIPTPPSPMPYANTTPSHYEAIPIPTPLTSISRYLTESSNMGVLQIIENRQIQRILLSPLEKNFLETARTLADTVLKIQQLEQKFHCTFIHPLCGDPYFLSLKLDLALAVRLAQEPELKNCIQQYMETEAKCLRLEDQVRGLYNQERLARPANSFAHRVIN